MTREYIKIMLPIMKAFAEGKTLQYRVNNENNEWKDINNPAFNDLSSEYRIKPELTYRSFKTKEECWNEMLKHQPFGWVRGKHPELLYQIISVSDFDVTLSIYEKSSFPASLIQFEFADGTPFGIKEE